jgi:hypothetical protein
MTGTDTPVNKAAERGYPMRRLCDHPGCTVVLLTQADNERCRLHRKMPGRCCGDPACGYGARRPF